MIEIKDDTDGKIYCVHGLKELILLKDHTQANQQIQHNSY